jgi:hypothetical protein
MGCQCLDGWICEAHPERGGPHDNCPGPGTACDNPNCPIDWIREQRKPELSWDRLIASPPMPINKPDRDSSPARRKRASRSAICFADVKAGEIAFACGI